MLCWHNSTIVLEAFCVLDTRLLLSDGKSVGGKNNTSGCSHLLLNIAAQILCTEKNLLCEPVAVNMSALQYAVCRVRKKKQCLNESHWTAYLQYEGPSSSSRCLPPSVILKDVRSDQSSLDMLYSWVFIMLTTVTCMHGLTQCSHIYINYTWMHCMHLFIYLVIWTEKWAIFWNVLVKACFHLQPLTSFS